MCRNWTKLLRQCFVAAGVSLNFISHGTVVSFSSVLISALRSSTEIPADEDTVTWIASIFGISFIFSALTVPWTINKFGRKPLHVVCAALMTSGWITIVVSSNITFLLLGRILQGLSMGILAILGSILIGEYSSPIYRGPLLATISTCLLVGLILMHTLEAFFHWRIIGMICGLLSFVDLVIILCSPESPTFLAIRGKYKKCRTVFHWLRGFDEDEELTKLIRTDMAKKRHVTYDNSQSVWERISNTSVHIKRALSKKELVKPILISLHLYAMNLWSGVVTFVSYTRDIIDIALGNEANFDLFVITLGVQRVISSLLGIVIVKKFRRRNVFAVMMSMNVFAYASLALYVYLKTVGLLNFDNVFLGVALFHIHSFSQAGGALVLSNIIPGEIFPTRYRALCGLIGSIFLSINEVIDIKTVPYLISTIGLHGMYVVHGSIVLYTMSMVLVMLPETKDRTLLDIEEDFRGKPLVTNDKLIESK